jgi:hypothetical protein
MAAQASPPRSLTSERAFIAGFSERQHAHPLPPDEVQQDPRNKELGRSSRALTVKDFDLMRTLGTGKSYLFCLSMFLARVGSMTTLTSYINFGIPTLHSSRNWDI